MMKKFTLMAILLASLFASCQNSDMVDNPRKKNGASRKALKTRTENPGNLHGFIPVYKFPSNLFYPSQTSDIFYGNRDVALTSVAASKNGEYVALKRYGESTNSGGPYDYVYNNIFIYKVNEGNNGLTLMQPQTGLESPYEEDFIHPGGRSYDIEFMPDNEHLVVSGDDYNGFLWVETYKMTEGKMVLADQVFFGPLSTRGVPVFSDDGKYMAYANGGSGKDDPGVKFYIRGSGVYMKYGAFADTPRSVYDYPASSCSISPNGRFLAIVNNSQTNLHLYKIDESHPDKLVEVPYFYSPEKYVTCSFSPDNKFLALGNGTGVTLFKVTTQGQVEFFTKLEMPDVGEIKWWEPAQDNLAFALLSGNELRAYRFGGSRPEEIEQVTFGEETYFLYGVSDFEFVKSPTGRLTLYVTRDPELQPMGTWGLSQYEYYNYGE